ncbi:hypothetical protein AYO22_05947 [Fonsecaea multimorphosa]|nr:hypothetical protein AYO22_05947 [Fonsecaea multimorphosa]
MRLNLFGRGRPLRWAVTFTCQLSFLFFGYDQGFMGGVITVPNFQKTFNHPRPVIIGITLAIFSLGALFGCIFNVIFGDLLGRRKSIGLAMVWVCIGAVLQASSYQLAQLMVGRFVGGFGVGIVSATVAMYQAEMCEAHIRGRLFCSQLIFVTLGVILALYLDYGMIHTTGSASWRVPVAVQLIFVLICAICILGLPESPRWLYSRGRSLEGLRVLCDIYDRNEDDPKIRSEQLEILRSIELELAGSHFAWKHVFKQDTVRTSRRILVSCGVVVMNQLAGINLLIYYMPTILIGSIGTSVDNAILITGCVGVLLCLSTGLITALVDRVGRRGPLLYGSLGCGINMMIISILLALKDSTDSKGLAAASIAFFFLFAFFYAIGTGTLAWGFAAELLPLHSRGTGTAVAAAGNWLVNFGIAMLSPVLISTISWKTYLIFMSFNLTAVPLIYFFVPETMNLTLEEIDLIFVDPHTSPVAAAKRLQQTRIRNLELGQRAFVEKFEEAIQATTVHHEISTQEDPVPQKK